MPSSRLWNVKAAFGLAGGKSEIWGGRWGDAVNAMRRVVEKRRFVDKHLRCAKCGCAFVLTAGEQELRALRGLPPATELCPNCARNRSPRGYASTQPG